MSNIKDDSKTISNEVPENAQDLTIFVQNLLDQMVMNVWNIFMSNKLSNYIYIFLFVEISNQDLIKCQLK